MTEPLTEHQQRILKAFIGKDEFDFNTFLRVLFGEEGMWYTFTFWAYALKYPLPDKDAYYRWLFHPDHRDRFCRLFIEFLGLGETQKDFGWEKCWQYAHGDHDLVCTFIECSRRNLECAITGQVMRPWLWVWKEGKE